MLNPYLTPGSQPIAKQRREYRFTFLPFLLYFYPLLPVAGAYLAWGLSALALGRMPVAYRDYPENLAILICGYTGGITLLIARIVLPFLDLCFGLRFGGHLAAFRRRTSWS